MSADMSTVNTVYFGTSFALVAFTVGKAPKNVSGFTVVCVGAMFVLNLLALTGVLPK
jgi:hypothetical protein